MPTDRQTGSAADDRQHIIIERELTRLRSVLTCDVPLRRQAALWMAHPYDRIEAHLARQRVARRHVRTAWPLLLREHLDTVANLVGTK